MNSKILRYWTLSFTTISYCTIFVGRFTVHILVVQWVEKLSSNTTVWHFKDFDIIFSHTNCIMESVFRYALYSANKAANVMIWLEVQLVIIRKTICTGEKIVALFRNSAHPELQNHQKCSTNTHFTKREWKKTCHSSSTCCKYHQICLINDCLRPKTRRN